MARTLSQKIEELAHQCKGRKVMTVEEFRDLLGPSEQAIVPLIVSIPFILGLKLWWVGIIPSIIMISQGFRVALHKKLWLPKSWKRITFSGDHASSLLLPAVKFFRKLEKYVHPRGTIYQQHPLLLTSNGWVMMLGGFFLLFPWGRHWIAGLAVFLLSLGLLEEDILWMICAYVVVAVYFVTFFLR